MIPTSALKRLPLRSSSDPIVEIDEVELDEGDLLDIDGSDDQTLALSRGLAKRLAPKRNHRALVAVAPPAPPSEPEDARVTMPFGLEAHAPKPAPSPTKTPRIATLSAPAHFAFAAAPPKNTAPDLDVTVAREPAASTAHAPAHFAHAEPRKRNATSSYPPIAIAVAGREKALSFIQERPSRAGWIAAAVIAVVLLVGGSMRIGAPSAPSAQAVQPSEPPPAAVAPFEVKPETPADAKVVHFGDDQGIAIKSTPTAAAKPTPPKHNAPVAAKPAVKPAATPKLPDGSLGLGASVESKPAATPKTEKAISSAEKKKQQSIENELAEAQLRAAAR